MTIRRNLASELNRRKLEAECVLMASVAPPDAAEGLAEIERDPLDPARGIVSAVVLVALAVLLPTLLCGLWWVLTEWLAAGGPH